MTFGSGGFRLFLDGELVAWKDDVTTGLTTNAQNLVIGANTWLRDKYNPTWTGDYFDGTMRDFTIYNRALSRLEVAYVAPDGAAGPTHGTTGTGLDQLVDIIYADPGLYWSASASDIAAGGAKCRCHERADRRRDQGHGRGERPHDHGL